MFCLVLIVKAINSAVFWIKMFEENVLAVHTLHSQILVSIFSLGYFDYFREFSDFSEVSVSMFECLCLICALGSI